MKLAANLSLMFTEVPLPQRFAAARAAGFEAVEIQFPYSHPAAELALAREAAGVDVVLINVPAGDLMQGGNGLACVASRQPQFQQALQQAAEYADALNVAAINVLAGRADAADAEAALACFEDNLRLAADTLSPQGWLTTFEAINGFDMPGFLIQRAQAMWDTLARLGRQNVRAQYDIYHMARMGESVADDLGRHGMLIGHVQFADVPGRGEPGSGNLDFPALFGQLRAGGYLGNVAAEYIPTTTTAASLAWLQSWNDAG